MVSTKGIEARAKIDAIRDDLPAKTFGNIFIFTGSTGRPARSSQLRISSERDLSFSLRPARPNAEATASSDWKASRKRRVAGRGSARRCASCSSPTGSLAALWHRPRGDPARPLMQKQQLRRQCRPHHRRAVSGFSVRPERRVSAPSRTVRNRHRSPTRACACRDIASIELRITGTQLRPPPRSQKYAIGIQVVNKTYRRQHGRCRRARHGARSRRSRDLPQMQRHQRSSHWRAQADNVRKESLDGPSRAPDLIRRHSRHPCALPVPPPPGDDAGGHPAPMPFSLLITLGALYFVRPVAQYPDDDGPHARRRHARRQRGGRDRKRIFRHARRKRQGASVIAQTSYAASRTSASLSSPAPATSIMRVRTDHVQHDRTTSPMFMTHVAVTIFGGAVRFAGDRPDARARCSRHASPRRRRPKAGAHS